MSDKKYIELGKIIDAIMSIPTPADSYFAKITDAGKELCVSVVQNVQLADVAPVVHGHWKRKSQRFINKETGAVQAHYIWNECSLCRKHNQYKTDFCPYCGAKMESEDNDNE